MTAPPSGTADTVDAALALVAGDRRRIMASVMPACHGDLDLADDAVAEAMATAVTAWRDNGIPDNPAGWVVVVARRRAIDRIRSASRRRAREQRTAPAAAVADRGLAHFAGDGAVEDPMASLGALDVDDQLRLVFMCCHPALSTPAQVALTLRYVAGLTTAQVAAAFVVSPDAMARRIHRARTKVRDAGIPFRIPRDAYLPDRLAAVLAVVHLVFNEGYLPHDDDDLQRLDLAQEAIRLARLLHDLMPDEAEVTGLLALCLLTHARAPARVDATGALVVMADQDRSRWDADMIDEGRALLTGALRRQDLGRLQLEAAIAACHADAPTHDATDWLQIVALYDELVRMTGSPYAAVNGAVARAFAVDPDAGLAALEAVADRHDLEAWPYLHVARGELAAMAGDHTAAAASLSRARALTENPRERDHLDTRLAHLRSNGPVRAGEGD
ncbi:MAG TPA: sigma-70 family RNA polymerase sigma factor [Nitriliruptoraceae bacterium]|nr:sigma-70 family RNA polymerase sigma factor [Nitriliruptoraceae bacterium]